MFGGIKSCSFVSKTIPIQFKANYATMIINNLNSANSISSNCEDDESKFLLNDVHEMLLLRKEKPKVNTINSSIQNDYCTDMITFDPEILKTDLSFVQNEAITYMSSVVCRKILERTNCSQCLDSLQTSTNSKAHNIISKFSSSDHAFYKNPSLTFMQIFQRLFYVSNQVIPDICSEKCLKSKIVNVLENEIVENVGCDDHKDVVLTKIKQYAALYTIIDFTKNINNLLTGKNTVLPINSSSIHELALIFRQKGKHNGKHSDKFVEPNTIKPKRSVIKKPKVKALKQKILKSKPKAEKPKDKSPK